MSKNFQELRDALSRVPGYDAMAKAASDELTQELEDYEDIPEFLGEVSYEPEDSVMTANVTAYETLSKWGYNGVHALDNWAVDYGLYHVQTPNNDYWVDDYGYVVSPEHVLISVIEHGD